MTALGNGASGGVGTNYIANLIIGSTWSYVTGGPEFTNQPPASTSVASGRKWVPQRRGHGRGPERELSMGKDRRRCNQTVTDGTGAAGGTATVSGANTATLTLTAGVSAGDTGNYQLVATASGTGYTLNSTTANLRLPDPQITANPANATANYGRIGQFHRHRHHGECAADLPVVPWHDPAQQRNSAGRQRVQPAPPEPPARALHLLSR